MRRLRRAGGRGLALAVVLVVLAPACSDDAEPETGPAALLESAEVLPQVSIELAPGPDDTATVTVRNEGDGGAVAVLDPVAARRTTVDADDGRTDLYARPAPEASGEGAGDEPTRYPGSTVAAGQSHQLDTTVLLPTDGTLTVCIEVQSLTADRPSGEPADLPARQADDALTIACSEPLDLGDA